MKAFDLIRLLCECMKRLSECDIKMEDYKHVDMYQEFKSLVAKNEKKEYIKTYLAHKYKMSESTVLRIIRRLDKHVRN